jgi:hypothetical protein
MLKRSGIARNIVTDVVDHRNGTLRNGALWRRRRPARKLSGFVVNFVMHHGKAGRRIGAVNYRGRVRRRVRMVHFMMDLDRFRSVAPFLMNFLYTLQHRGGVVHQVVLSVRGVLDNVEVVLRCDAKRFRMVLLVLRCYAKGLRMLLLVLLRMVLLMILVMLCYKGRLMGWRRKGSTGFRLEALRGTRETCCLFVVPMVDDGWRGPPDPLSGSGGG